MRPDYNTLATYTVSAMELGLKHGVGMWLTFLLVLVDEVEDVSGGGVLRILGLDQAASEREAMEGGRILA